MRLVIPRPARGAPLAALLALAALLLVSTALAAGTRSTAIVSVGSSGGSGAFPAQYVGASSDGSRAFFRTKEQLVPADEDAAYDLYERAGGATNLLSTGPTGGGGGALSYVGASADGSRVFFRTTESLVAEDEDAANDIYERSGGATALLSTGPEGGNGGQHVDNFGASADGSRVFFRTAESLVAEDADASSDVYERAAGVTTLLSTGPDGGDGAFAATYRGSSADGSRVFFETDEALVEADEDGGSRDIYRRQGGVTTLLSTGPDGEDEAVDTEFDGASADGSRVFFRTAESLVAEDTDASSDVYERAAGVTTLVSTGPNGYNGAHFAEHVGNSVDGSRVFFRTDESLVKKDSDAARDIYERAAGVTTLVSTGPAVKKPGPQDVYYGGASADGSRVFFETTEALVEADEDAAADVYERSGGTTTLLSTSPEAHGSPNSIYYAGSSADGSRVVLETDESLAAADLDEGSTDVYERAGGVTTMLSNGPLGAATGEDAEFAGASADGARVFFETAAALVAADGDSEDDVYASLLDLPESGEADGDGGADGSGERGGPSPAALPLAAPLPAPPAAMRRRPRCFGKPATKVGTPRRDVIKGTGRRDVIVAFGGNDKILARGGNDLICAGGGNDLVLAGRGRDRARGQAGRDRLFGQGGRDLLIGNGGNDLLVGGPARDRCRGGVGRDRQRRC
jgi:Ca2+-binding RTX toxin-like protein